MSDLFTAIAMGQPGIHPSAVVVDLWDHGTSAADVTTLDRQAQKVALEKFDAFNRRYAFFGDGWEEHVPLDRFTLLDLGDHQALARALGRRWQERVISLRETAAFQYLAKHYLRALLRPQFVEAHARNVSLQEKRTGHVTLAWRLLDPWLASLDEFEVDERYRRRGLGTAAYARWERKLPATVRRVVLVANSATARRFWATQGFALVFAPTDPDSDEQWMVKSLAPGRENGPRAPREEPMKSKTAKPAIKLDWHTYAGGTFAKEGTHSYDAKGWFGEFHVWPPQLRAQGERRRTRGYLVQWANSTGLAVTHTHAGLWHDVGVFRSPAIAKKAARDYLSAHLLPFAPAEGEDTRRRPGAAAPVGPAGGRDSPPLWCIFVGDEEQSLRAVGWDAEEAIRCRSTQAGSPAPRDAVRAEPARAVAARVIANRLHRMFFRDGEEQEIGSDEIGDIGNLLEEQGFGVHGPSVAPAAKAVAPTTMSRALRVADVLHDIFFRDGEETDVGADETADIADLLTRNGFGLGTAGSGGSS